MKLIPFVSPVILTVFLSQATGQVSIYRGDYNADGIVDFTDLIELLGYSPEYQWPPHHPTYSEPSICPDSADVNRSGRFDELDTGLLARYILQGDPDFPDDPVCTLPEIPPSHPLADVSLSFEGCPETILPGAAFDLYVVLTTSNNSTLQGAKGWTIGVAADGADIKSIETAGITVPSGYDLGSILTIRGGMEWFPNSFEVRFPIHRIVPIPGEPSSFGGISMVSLVDWYTWYSGMGPLPPEGSQRIARIRLEVPGPADHTRTVPVTVRFQDGLIDFAHGGPLKNAVYLGGRAHAPALGTCSCTVQLVKDCNGNGTSDDIDISSGTSPDCNGNGFPDECDVKGESLDCDGNGVPDECDVLVSGNDCNGNGIPDACDLLVPGMDCDGNGIIDSCEGMTCRRESWTEPSGETIGRPFKTEPEENWKVEGGSLVGTNYCAGWGNIRLLFLDRLYDWRKENLKVRMKYSRSWGIYDDDVGIIFSGDPYGDTYNRFVIHGRNQEWHVICDDLFGFYDHNNSINSDIGSINVIEVQYYSNEWHFFVNGTEVATGRGCIPPMEGFVGIAMWDSFGEEEDPCTRTLIEEFRVEYDAGVYQNHTIVAFLRGDSNADTVVDISDPVNTLGTLFQGGGPGGGAIGCMDSADANDDGTVDISDAISTLVHLFIDSSLKIPPPSKSPGIDMTSDDVRCE